MSKVFVVQQQRRFDEVTGNYVNKFDLEQAKEFGELVYLLSPTAAPFNSEPIIEELHEKLSFITAEDYIVLIGNPCLMGWVVAIAADYTGGNLNLLQWSGRDQRYVLIKVEDLFRQEEIE